MSFTSTSNGLASHFYEYERGDTVYGTYQTYWIGKIGLMYPSDYGYATSGGTSKSRTACLAQAMFNWDSSSYSDCKNNNYIFKTMNQWTMTPRSSTSDNVFYIVSSAYLNSTRSNSSYNVSPTLYLKNDVSIIGGDGSQTSPYELGI